MIYPQRDNKRKKKKVATAIILISVFVLIILLIARFVPTLFSPATQTVARPLFVTRNLAASALGTFFQSFRSEDSLQNENNQLKEQLAVLQAAEIEREFFKQKADELQALMGRVPKDKSTLMATILSKPGFSPYDTVILDAGEDENIQVGKPVYADASTVVGVISTVNARFSTVTLYSSPDQRADVLIGSSTLQSVAVGLGGGNFEVRLPRNSGVVEGDTVTLASDHSHIIGKIGSITVTPTDSFEEVLFKSPVDISRLTYLFVEK